MSNPHDTGIHQEQEAEDNRLEQLSLGANGHQKVAHRNWDWGRVCDPTSRFQRLTPVRSR